MYEGAYKKLLYLRRQKNTGSHFNASQFLNFVSTCEYRMLQDKPQNVSSFFRTSHSM